MNSQRREYIVFISVLLYFIKKNFLFIPFRLSLHFDFTLQLLNTRKKRSFQNQIVVCYKIHTCGIKAVLIIRTLQYIEALTFY